jgi:hypothetical protein
MRRTSRRFVAVMTLLGFFGMQWALAAHACASASEVPAATAVTAAQIVRICLIIIALV